MTLLGVLDHRIGRRVGRKHTPISGAGMGSLRALQSERREAYQPVSSISIAFGVPCCWTRPRVRYE
jgi:hypothetical protein